MAYSLDNLPRLSVLVVVRNAATTVARTMDSLLAQHYPNLEVIVWDGLSTDGTLDVLARYSSLITTLRSEKDKGSSDGYNRAMALATGDYVGILNADDEYEPGALWAVADCLIQKPNAEVVTFGMLFHTNHKVTGYYADEVQLSLTLERVLSDIPSFVPSRFFRRTLLAEIGPIETDMRLWYYANDREYMTRWAVRGCKNNIIPKALYRFELHEKGISNNPDNYMRIIEEHSMIAAHLLKDTRLSASQCSTIERWRERQLMFGFWIGLFTGKISHAKNFMREGFRLKGWRIVPLAFCVLAEKLLKRLGLKLSSGIDRGII